MLRPRAVSTEAAVFPVRTPTLLPATHTNAYALGTRDVLLIEPATPYEDEQRAFVEWARGLEASGRKPIAIVATHHHPDHVGGLPLLARELDLPVWMHRETASRVPGCETARARALADGETIVLEGPTPSSWDVLHTPGHAPGHVCLYNRASGDLIAGDMVASVGSIVIIPGDGDMRLYVDQLARLDALGATQVLPAHGEPIDRERNIFQMYIAHRMKRESLVVDALVATKATVDAPVEPSALLPVAYADTPAAMHPFALLSLRAHLDKLVTDGRVRTDGERFGLV